MQEPRCFLRLKLKECTLHSDRTVEEALSEVQDLLVPRVSRDSVTELLSHCEHATIL